MVSIYDNVRYLSGISSLFADKAEIDILIKEQKFLWKLQIKRFWLITSWKMAIIKKFRIKSFKQKKPILKLDKVSLSFGDRQILEDINFEINKGEILVCLGQME